MLTKKEKLHQYKIFSEIKGVPKEFILANWQGNLLDSMKNCARLKSEGGGCATKKTLAGLKEKIKLLENPPHKLVDNIDWVVYNEKKLFGVSITAHSTDSASSELSSDTSCKDFVNGKTGFMTFVVEIKQCKEHVIKKGNSEGKKMAFLSIEDSSCSISDVCVFAGEYEEFASLLYEGAIVMIQGERDKKKNSLVVKKVVSI